MRRAWARQSAPEDALDEATAKRNGLTGGTMRASDEDRTRGCRGAWPGRALELRARAHDRGGRRRARAADRVARLQGPLDPGVPREQGYLRACGHPPRG